MATTKQLRELSQAMLVSVRGYWTQAESYQKFLYLVGLLLLASAVFHTGVLILTRGSLEGDVSWRKPILFGESFGLTCLSLAWVMTFLPKWRVMGWLLAGTLGLANLGEVFLVAMQQWRGVASHFNNSTPFDTAVFLAMGLLIFLTGAVTVILTLTSFVALRATPSFAWAIRVGLVLLVTGQVFGISMIRLNSHTFGAAGNLKLIHALALHGAQILPLLAWLAGFTNWTEARCTAWVLLGAIGYAALVSISALQAFSGRAPLDLPLGATLVLGAGAVFLAGAYAAALAGLQARR